jgi:SecD/SecF fusion protein
MIRILLMIVGAAVGALLLAVGATLYFKHRQGALLSQRPAHGLAFVLEVDRSEAADGTNDLALLKQAVQQRGERAGVQLFWEPVSATRINVAVTAQNPGDAGGLAHALFDRGRLEFRLVHETSEQLLENSEVPIGYELILHEVAAVSGAKPIEKLLVKKTTERGLAGNMIKSAMVTRGQLNEPQINFTLRPEAAAAFGKVTSENIDRRLAIILDGRLYSAPTIKSPITTGNGQITGQFSMEEAFALAAAMDTPLPMAVTVVETKAY